MDLSLNQILEKFDKIYKNTNNSHILSYNKNKNNLQELDKILTNIKTVLYKVDNIYHICENEYSNMYNLKKTNKKLNSQILQSNLINVNIAPNIPIKVISVNSLYDIPITPMYWINDICQFGININGVVLRGNIGNIFDKSHIQSGNKISQTIICKYGNTCKLIMNGKLCKFYHDPCDLLKIYKSGLMTRNIYDIYKSLHRNFINTSWLHTNIYNNKKNINMRHFGSRNTLKCDFDLMNLNHDILSKNIHVQNYNHQCIHDILVILGMQNSRDLSEVLI
jgi:hypothetical protein